MFSFLALSQGSDQGLCDRGRLPLWRKPPLRCHHVLAVGRPCGRSTMEYDSHPCPVCSGSAWTPTAQTASRTGYTMEAKGGARFPTTAHQCVAW